MSLLPNAADVRKLDASERTLPYLGIEKKRPSRRPLQLDSLPYFPIVARQSMKVSHKIRVTGVAAGIALFVAVGLFVTIASNKPSAQSVSSSGPVSDSLVAPAVELGKAFQAVAAHVKPAVVSVYSEKTVKIQAPGFPFPFGDDLFEQFFGQQPNSQPQGQPREHRFLQHGMGSGMVLDQAGHILTNYHVVADVDKIKVQLADRRSFPATIVGADPKTDIAVIKIAGDVPRDLPSIQLGDSDALEVGYLVIAVGAPFGLAQTVTHGIISAKGRSDVGISTYENFLQTDAPINPGNSGGPLVNMRGEVIGMNSAIATGGGAQSAGVGFAIPSNMIKTMLPTLIKGGQISRGVLGVVVQDLDEDLAQSFHLSSTSGALVAQVGKDSPAERAGIQSGDVIVRFDGKEIADSQMLRNVVAASTPGHTVEVDVIRDGKERAFRVTIGSMPTESAATAKPTGKAEDQIGKLGLQVQTLTPELAHRYHLPDEKGVLVTDVQEASAAATANLQPGDVIVEANHMPVSSVDALQMAIGKAHGQVLLRVKRGGASFFVIIRPE